MKAYSVDLRQKIIDTYNSESISQRKLAKRFRVALSFIYKLLKQYRQSGDIAPKVRTLQTPTKLNEPQLQVLKQLVEANNDATLEELRDQLEQATGVRIGRSTTARMLQRLQITLKKRFTPVKKK
ncbi:transcriptional regulator, partial [Neosynechococcus sphagnicola sy1]